MTVTRAMVRLFTAFLFAVCLSNFAQAQSALERLAVPKSKLISSFWQKSNPSSSVKVDHSPFDAFLSRYVSKDNAGVARVAYSQVSAADKAALKTYIASLEAVDVPGLNRNEQYAFWLNLYNARTVLVVLDNFPLKSIRDVKKGAFDVSGPFNDDVVTVNGKTLSLNDIESGIVRPIWNDPLLHYGFNCAAISCPNLNSQAFQGDQVSSQLTAAARSFVNDPRGIAIQNGKATASKIYFWYEDDFGGSEKTILAHIQRYASAELKQRIAQLRGIDEYVYDWSLNGR